MQINLLTTYLLLRQLTPTLPFEVFLEKYALLADADEVNLKMPDAAIDRYLPRSKAKATQYNERQWSAKEVTAYIAVYVDMIRAAEDADEPVPLTLNEWLASDVLKGQFLSGAFNIDAPEAKEETSTTAVLQETQEESPIAHAVPAAGTADAPKKKKIAPVVLPSKIGDRVLLKLPNGSTVRGVATSFDETETGVYVDVKDDSGQQHNGVSINKTQVISDPPPTPRQDIPAASAEVIEIIAVDLTTKEYDTTLGYLQHTTKVEAEDGVELWEWCDSVSHNGKQYMLWIVLRNGTKETSPYVDSYITDADSPDNDPLYIKEYNPRSEALCGEYLFDLPHGTVQVLIAKEQDA